YSDFLGLNRTLVLRENAVAFPPGDADALAAFDTTVSSWSRRWGKILYDKVERGGSYINIYVYTSDDTDGFPPVDSDKWIPVDDRNTTRDRDNFNARIGESPLITSNQFPAPGELVGRYLKFKIVTRSDRDGNLSEITNLRITCLERVNGVDRYICQ
ncbi:MAG: hypothetical protein Q7S23_02800, partial [bacterium]|nr:hypothetical protein [bacterium]